MRVCCPAIFGPSSDIHCRFVAVVPRTNATEALASVRAQNFQTKGSVGGVKELARMHVRAREGIQREVRSAAEFFFVFVAL